MHIPANRIRELKMLGTVVIYRASNKLLGNPILAGSMTAFDHSTGKTSLSLVGQGYHIHNIPYSPTLERPNTWCYKEDLNSGTLEANAPESVDELRACGATQGAVSEDDTVVPPPSQETQPPGP